MVGFFSPCESYTFVKLQLLDQSQEFIYSAESTSTGSLALQTRQAPFWGGICGSRVAQGQHRAQDTCGEGVMLVTVFICLFTSHQRGGWGNFVFPHWYCCVWVEGKAHSCPRIKSRVLLAHNLLNKSHIHRNGQFIVCCFIPCKGKVGREGGKGVLPTCW